MNTTTAPTTPTNQHDIAAALGGISQTRYQLRAARRVAAIAPEVPGMESLIEAIECLTVSVECLAQVVARSVRP